MRPDRAIWAVGLALACTVLAGLVLNLTVGLTRLTWLITLAAAVVIIGGVVLLLRRRGMRAVLGESVIPDVLKLSPLTMGIALLAAAFAAAAVWLAVASASWQQTPGFAQLWLVPAAGPRGTLAIRSEYPQKHTFHLVLRTGKKTVTTWNLTLADGQSWQRNVGEPPGQPLVATLTTPGRTLTVSS
jgi:nitrate reductase gamma subunit